MELIIVNKLKLSGVHLELAAWSLGELLQEFYKDDNVQQAFEEWKIKKGGIANGNKENDGGTND
ncbi:MAG: hypothetical protein IJ033_02365 [Clostridia bacterium]|nr:hypothetical protein [Clostridia bacterium]